MDEWIHKQWYLNTSTVIQPLKGRHLKLTKNGKFYVYFITTEKNPLKKLTFFFKVLYNIRSFVRKIIREELSFH